MASTLEIFETHSSTEYIDFYLHLNCHLVRVTALTTAYKTLALPTTAGGSLTFTKQHQLATVYSNKLHLQS